MTMYFSRAWFAGALLVLVTSARAEVTARALPCPLPAHPGNIFLVGEPVSVAALTNGAAGCPVVAFRLVPE